MLSWVEGGRELELDGKKEKGGDNSLIIIRLLPLGQGQKCKPRIIS